MNYEDCTFRRPRSLCPELIIEVNPGLPEGALNVVFQGIPKDCDTTPCIWIDEHRLQRWVVVPLPHRFPSDRSWWIDMKQISAIIARIVEIGWNRRSWHGSLRIRLVTDGSMEFRDTNGLQWEATTEALVFEQGILQYWHESTAVADLPAVVEGMLRAENNLLVGLPIPYVLPPCIIEEIPVCFHTLLVP